VYIGGGLSCETIRKENGNGSFRASKREAISAVKGKGRGTARGGILALKDEWLGRWLLYKGGDGTAGIGVFWA